MYRTYANAYQGILQKHLTLGAWMCMEILYAVCSHFFATLFIVQF